MTDAQLCEVRRLSDKMIHGGLPDLGEWPGKFDPLQTSENYIFSPLAGKIRIRAQKSSCCDSGGGWRLTSGLSHGVTNKGPTKG